MKIGSLFSGYGGLEMGIQQVFPHATVAWHAEIEPAPAQILAHHWPDTPNLGDITKVDWASVEPVDIICGGSPCQDLSTAGKRAGMKADTRSGLWVSMLDAIETIRPELVVWENVRGAYSADADSQVEPCSGCVGDGSAVALRALGRVLGDLANLGYDTRWCGLRASDAGAPHERFRVFVAANPGGRQFTRSAVEGDRLSIAGKHSRESTTDTASRHVLDHTVRQTSTGSTVDWGEYEPAIRRWQHIIGRPPPEPTELGADDKQRSSPRFVEWMMGLPEGHVTNVNISRTSQHKALGNGVVPQQAAEAVKILLKMKELNQCGNKP